MHVFSFSLLPSLVALLGASTLVSAASVCQGDQFAIGTGSVNATTAQTTYIVYTASTCAVSHTLAITSATPCDNSYFLCSPGTTTYLEYDDPTTGKSYLNVADPTAGEKCGTDAITYCSYYGYGPS